MKILDRNVQLISDEERENSHHCFICGDEGKSVKYTIDIGKYTIHLCNRCVAIYCGNRDFKDVFKAAMKTSESYFDGDKIIKKHDVENEYAMIKEMNGNLKPTHDNTIDDAIKNIFDKKEKTKNMTEFIEDINNLYYKGNTLEKDDHRAFNEYFDEKYGKDEEDEYPDYKLNYYGDPDIERFFSKKIPYAVRLYTAENNQDYAIFKYKGGITFQVNLSIYGYKCLEKVNGYTLFYDERKDFCSTHNILIEDLEKYSIVVIKYGKNYTPIASIYESIDTRLCRRFEFNNVESFNINYVALIQWREQLPKNDRKPIYFIDLREKAPFDSLNM